MIGSIYSIETDLAGKFQKGKLFIKQVLKSKEVFKNLSMRDINVNFTSYTFTVFTLKYLTIMYFWVESLIQNNYSTIIPPYDIIVFCFLFSGSENSKLSSHEWACMLGPQPVITSIVSDSVIFFRFITKSNN